MQSFEHRHHIFRRNIGQDIVDLLEYKTTAGSKGFYLLPNVAAHRLWRAVRQDRLRIAAAAPENHLLPKFRFELPGIHTGARYLDRIDSVQSGVNQVR